MRATWIYIKNFESFLVGFSVICGHVHYGWYSFTGFYPRFLCCLLKIFAETRNYLLRRWHDGTLILVLWNSFLPGICDSATVLVSTSRFFFKFALWELCKIREYTWMIFHDSSRVGYARGNAFLRLPIGCVANLIDLFLLGSWVCSKQKQDGGYKNHTISTKLMAEPCFRLFGDRHAHHRLSDGKRLRCSCTFTSGLSCDISGCQVRWWSWWTNIYWVQMMHWESTTEKTLWTLAH